MPRFRSRHPSPVAAPVGFAMPPVEEPFTLVSDLPFRVVYSLGRTPAEDLTPDRIAPDQKARLEENGFRWSDRMGRWWKYT